MMFQAVLSNRTHPEYGVATIRSPSPVTNTHTAWSFWMRLRSGDAVKADCMIAGDR